MNDAISRVMSLSDLKPSPDVNQAFSQLVQAVTSCSEGADCFCDQSEIGRLQHRCALAESEMEQAWARRIIHSPNPLKEMESFIYMDNYIELVRREINLIGQTNLAINQDSSVLMIGSGPLPLSSWQIWSQIGARVVNVDNSPTAIELSSKLAELIDWPSDHILADGRDKSAVKGSFDVIYVAALAGDCLGQKQQIVGAVLPLLKDGGRLVLRGANGARELLYPAFLASDIHGVELLKEYHPTDEIINSVFVYGGRNG